MPFRSSANHAGGAVPVGACRSPGGTWRAPGPFRLDRRTALVTGAGRGIARLTCLALAAAGADVALIARTPDAIAEVATEVREIGRGAIARACDVSDHAEGAAVAREIAELSGGLQIRVNNVGGAPWLHGSRRSPSSSSSMSSPST